MNIQIHIFFTIFLLQKSIRVSNCARILFFMGMATHSHRVAMQPLANKLAQAGHQVTFLSPIKPEVPNANITEFRPKVMEQLNRRIGIHTAKIAVESKVRDPYGDPLLQGTFLWDIAYEVQASLLRNQEFVSWCEAAKFDLVIVDHPTKEIAFALAYKMKSKTIAFGTGGAPIMSDPDMFGMPVESYWLHDWTLGSRNNWFLPDRFIYTYNAISWYFSYTWYYLPKLDRLIERTLQSEIPPLEQLIRNVDLCFLNEHFSFAYARALPPTMVPIGGIHITEPNETLPQNLQEFLGDDDFILVSFGSIIKAEYLPDNMQEMMLEAVREFENIKFLWKGDDILPAVKPIKNMLSRRWLPQNDLLGHPKCRGFISQAGALSLQQAAYHGVPVIAIPIWGDQSFNARSLVHHGSGILLELSSLTQATFTGAITDLLLNESYSQQAEKVSRNFKDRPMSPLETAVWWTEYVLRQNETTHIKSPGMYKAWWQRRFLDFWLFSLSLLVFVILVLYYVAVHAVGLFKGLVRINVPVPKIKLT